MKKTFKILKFITVSFFGVMSLSVFSMMNSDNEQVIISKIISAPKNSLQKQVFDLNNQIEDLKRQLTKMQGSLNQIVADQKNGPFIDSSGIWVEAKSGNYPKDSFVAGYDGENPMYICNVAFLEGVHPGQLTKEGCYISYKHQAFLKQDYKVLTSKDVQKFFWAPASANETYPPIYPMANNLARDQSTAVIGGYEDIDKHPLFICRTIYDNHIHLGKVVSSKCNIGVDSIEIEVPNYEMLYQLTR